MNDRPSRGEPAASDAAIARISRPLRETVFFDTEFDTRVMRAVRAAARGTRSAWWRRGYTLRVTPLTGLALAASLALVAVLGRLSATPRATESPRVAAAALPAHDTVYVVRFTLVHPEAHQVALVGDFNGWSPSATPLVGEGTDGVWTASVPLPAGRHEYAFIVDGERWVSDPYANTVNDEFGTSSSVLRVGSAS